MYLMTLAIMASSLIRPASQETSALTLFRTMEKKICSTERLHLEIEADCEILGRSTIIKIDYRLASNNKLRLMWQQPERNGDGYSTKIFGSNGKTERVVFNKMLMYDGTVERPFDQPVNHRGSEPFQMRVSMLCRIGCAAYFLMAFENRDTKESVDFAKSIQTRDHVVLGKERIGSSESIIIAYAVDYPGGRLGKAKVWIDRVTMLPIKRELNVSIQGRETHIVETYKAFRLDPIVDSKFFEVLAGK
jgi:hypothetical protein